MWVFYTCTWPAKPIWPVLGAWKIQEESRHEMEGEEREGSEVFLHEMCLLGNFAKSSLCIFQKWRETILLFLFNPSNHFLLLLLLCVTSQLSSEADPEGHLSLHWWIASFLWANLAWGGNSLHPLWGGEERLGRCEPERSLSTLPFCHRSCGGWPTFLTVLGFDCFKHQQMTHFLELGWDSEHTYETVYICEILLHILAHFQLTTILQGDSHYWWHHPYFMNLEPGTQGG